MQGPRRSSVVGIAVVAVAVAAIAAMAVVPMLAAAQGTVDWTITAREEGDCPDATFCFELSQDSFEAGTDVNATFTNPENNTRTHDALVELDGNWDTGHKDTSKAESDGGVEEVTPGNESSFTFTVPSDRNDFYLWCDVIGHEGAGMWAVVDITGTDTGGDGGGDGTGDGDGTTDGPSTPGFSALAGLAAAGVAVLVLKRRD